jgi:hypothetical protein
MLLDTSEQNLLVDLIVRNFCFAEEAFFCFVLFCFVLFCFVLFCFVLFCFVLLTGQQILLKIYFYSYDDPALRLNFFPLFYSFCTKKIFKSTEGQKVTNYDNQMSIYSVIISLNLLILYKFVQLSIYQYFNSCNNYFWFF